MDSAAAGAEAAPCVLTDREAFVAMRLFVRRFADEAGDDLLTLLGDISPGSDGMPFDRAAWGDWLECIRRVKSEDLQV